MPAKKKFSRKSARKMSTWYGSVASIDCFIFNHYGAMRGVKMAKRYEIRYNDRSVFKSTLTAARKFVHGIQKRNTDSLLQVVPDWSVPINRKTGLQISQTSFPRLKGSLRYRMKESTVVPAGPFAERVVDTIDQPVPLQNRKSLVSRIETLEAQIAALTMAYQELRIRAFGNQ